MLDEPCVTAKFPSLFNAEKKIKSHKHSANQNGQFLPFCNNNQASIAPKKISNQYTKKSTFEKFENIMEKVEKKYKVGEYQDIITQSKYNHRGKLQKKPKDVENEFKSSSSEESEDEAVEQADFVESIIYQRSRTQITPQYFQVDKLLRYLKISNQAGTLLCLCSLRQMKLKDSASMRAIDDNNGVELLLNLLDVKDVRCKIASLQVLRELAEVNHYSRNITFLGGIEPLVKCLKVDNSDVKRMGADILACLAIFRLARSNIRRFDGITYLVQLLDVDLLDVDPNFNMHGQVHSSTTKKTITKPRGRVAHSCAEALWVCSKSKNNRTAMRQAGVIPILARLLHSTNAQILVPLIGTLQECASDIFFQISIRTEGMIPILINHMASKNVWLKVQCSLTIFKSAENEETRNQVYILGGLQVFHSLLRKSDNIHLMYAVTGAIWKCCLCTENATAFQNMGTTTKLVSLLQTIPGDFHKYLRPQISASKKLNDLEMIEKVMVNITGALSELTKLTAGVHSVRDAKGIEPLLKLLNMTQTNLLVNISRTISHCAADPQSMVIITQLEGVRMLVSLMGNRNAAVQANACWALSPVIKHAVNAGELVRSFVGSLELIVNLLRSTEEDVLTATCSTIAQIAKDQENLGVITDHGTVELLSRLVTTSNNRLRCYLARAIAQCCRWKDNAARFGAAGVVMPIITFLHSSDDQVLSATARALYQLSQDPTNSVEMNQAGVARLLIGMVNSENQELQLAAAGAIGNMRRLAYIREKKSKPIKAIFSKYVK